MAIPYHDTDELSDLGIAGYLKIKSLQEGTGYIAALFLINARGEPIEFTYNQIETPHTFLWRKNDIRRYAVKKLVVSLLSLSPKIPRLIFCLAEEVDSELFCQDIHLSIPVCRIAPAIKAISYAGIEIQDSLEAEEPMNLFWYPGKPSDDAVELKLLHELTSRGLLSEPFKRAEIGLQEVYLNKGKL